jgi:hypothetical protein
VTSLAARSEALERVLQKLGSLPKLAVALGVSSFDEIERWRAGIELTPDSIFLRAVDLLSEATSAGQ